MKEIRLGIVGLGRLGYIHANNILNNITGAKLVAACSLNNEELNKIKNKINDINGYDNYEKMIDQAKLDAIIIVSSSNQHYKHSTIALNKGLHVFCEKPLGINLNECLGIKKLVDLKKNLIFMLGFMRRYDPSYIYIKENIDKGVIGKPILFRGYSVDPESQISNSIKYAKYSGGQFLDMAIHDIDLSRWFLKSEPKTIFSVGGCYSYPEFSKYKDGDNVTSLMQFKNGSMAFFLAGRTASHGYNVETEVIGTKATIKIASAPQKSLVQILDNKEIAKECFQSFQDRFKQAFINEIQEFINCIVQSRKPEITIEDGIQATLIAEKATESFRENKQLYF